MAKTTIDLADRQPPEVLYMPVGDNHMIRTDRYYRHGPMSPEGYDQWQRLDGDIVTFATPGKKTRVARYVLSGYFDAQSIPVLTEVKPDAP